MVNTQENTEDAAGAVVETAASEAHEATTVEAAAAETPNGAVAAPDATSAETADQADAGRADAGAAPANGETGPAAEATDADATPTDVEPGTAEQAPAEQPAAEPAEKTFADGLPLVLPLAEMSPEDRFRATTRLIFLAPDVPPVQPMPRRNELRKLDDILDSRFPGNDSRDRNQRDRGERDRDQDRQERDSDRGGRDSGNTRGNSRRRQGGAEHDEDEGRRQQRQAPVITEPQKLRGSTRLEAKKQRRRDGRDAGRKRMVITESEFLARRESVDREMIVRTTPDRIQIGVLEDKVLVEHYVARSSESSLIGNVYLGRVQNVLPSMEAAFVDIGRGRNAVLYSGEVDWSEFEGGNTARKIENALKPGDQVLVQVTKDPVGHKGARLTSQISLPGRFLVYVPGGAMNGISRKLPDTERARLKKILKEVLPSGAGVIVRTAAEGATEDQLTHDVQRLTRQWESIQARVKKGGGPAMLHSEPDMLIKIVRDVFNEDFLKMRIEGAETHEVIENYLSAVAPDLMQRVERYEGERDIFDEFRVTEQIAKALDRKVWLPSGGSLVIDRTEAMTVVDVNTGKFVGAGGNLEETVTKNNLESAEEIVRQLRLRDIGGIIVIDFIDMVLESNRDLVLRRLIECLGRDRTKHQVAEVTSLGLVQMTRKKLGLGLLESFSEPCEVCAGRGVIVHHEPVHRHRNESSGRQKRGGNNSGSNGNGSANGKAQTEPKAQTHAISDGAKNMLAQVAASTIPTAKTSDDAAPTAVLESVLDALPDAPPAGASKSRNRRVSSRAGAPASAPKAQEPAAAGGATRDESDRGAAANAPTASDRERSEERGEGRGVDPMAQLAAALDGDQQAPARSRGSRSRSTRAQSQAGGQSAANAANEATGPSADGGALDPERMLLDALDARTQGRGEAQADTPTHI
ncbi:Rne/Rng family ribonuclease [Leucobacter aridicollis]|uniref:Rne/Rng family ribonuclease n=1 Tax=Leucobacter aridicollis TaxID=283878 RepID=UPI002167FD87|nr:Rne/Rng family ribonuclease [Leucobacter aridicollis]MCS3428531.1 ribonuclease E [Leucobacter aridicollis]